MGMDYRPGPVPANLACFTAMVMWAFAFPASEVLMESWGALALIAVRMGLTVAILIFLWVWADGLLHVRKAPWVRGLTVGGIGFGIGMVLLLIGQKMSNAVTPAIAAAMMPIAGAAIEVIFDKRKLRLHLIIGIAFALTGGILATGVKLTDGTFGTGALLCLIAVVLFAWATRATTRDFQTLSPIGQTTITLIGSLIVAIALYGLSCYFGFGETHIGLTDFKNMTLLIAMSVASLALSQLLWIWGAGGLGVLLASLHMNAVPFYVMVIVVVFMDEKWGWDQAIGAALVATGVMVAQSVGRKKQHPVSSPLPILNAEASFHTSDEQ
jgi:drug/metabolite transporter (DMT)-like permease